MVLGGKEKTKANKSKTVKEEKSTDEFVIHLIFYYNTGHMSFDMINLDFLKVRSH